MESRNQEHVERRTGDPRRLGKEVLSVEKRETNSELWFSHEEDIWNAELKGTQKVFYWTGKSQTWDWDSCTISWLILDGKSSSNATIRVVIRSLRNVFSDYRKKNVNLRYMRGFDIDGIKMQRPKEEKYSEPRSNKPKTYGEERTRWALSLDNNHTIWQWKEEGKSIEESKVFEIYSGILKSLEEQTTTNPSGNDIFNVVAYDDNSIGKMIVPVIYQPAIDSWKNFVREVHCHEQDHGRIVEVSLLFNNEELRRHKVANRIYEWFRSWFYGRTIDVETFHIRMNDINTPELLDFGEIYSGDNNIQEDSIHLDKRGIRIKYYFGNSRHPIIFINTSNHAMAEHDTNHELWKWEYVAWQEDGAVEFHTKSRKKINDSFKPKLRGRFW